MFVRTVQGASGRCRQVCNPANIFSILIMLVMLTAVVCGELLIWGYFGPIALGTKFFISLLVLVASGMIGIIVGFLTTPEDEDGKVTKSGSLFAIVALILGVLAMIQFVGAFLIVFVYVLNLFLS